MLYNKRKRVFKIIIVTFLLILIASCGNFGKKKDKEKKEVKEVKETKIEKKAEKINKEYSGLVIPLDSSNFLIENDLLYNNNQPFTGRVTFATVDGYSGYFTFNAGILEGVYELKKSGYEEIGRLVRNNYVYVKYKYNFGLEVEKEYDENTGLLKRINQTTNGNEYNFEVFSNFSGELKKEGKAYKFSGYKLGSEISPEMEQKNTKIVTEEKNGTFVYSYNYTQENGYVIIKERKYKGDEKKYKYLVFIDETTITAPENTQDMMIIFKNIFKSLQNGSAAQTNNNNTIQQPTPENNIVNAQNTANTINNNVASQNNVANIPNNTVNTQNRTVNNQNATANNYNSNQNIDRDLAVLDKVYDEVINKGNVGYLNNFSSGELAIIRNTIYARRGYIFQKDKYRNYFSRKSWYRGTSYSENIVTPNEKRLAEMILSRE